MSDAAATGRPTPAAPSIAPLDEILLASLAALAAAGEVEEACRLAGRACAVHRTTDPAAWNRYNVLLHRLARKAVGAHSPST
ncbi:MAG: hypothetical protein IT522_12120 [Burkholderiales bacterium]|nr:hypothetical protein [Burkholderiales bacterium]